MPLAVFQSRAERAWCSSALESQAAADLDDVVGIEALYQKATGLLFDRSVFSSDGIFVQWLSF